DRDRGGVLMAVTGARLEAGRLGVRVDWPCPRQADRRVTYITDGIHLYEILHCRSIRNYGLRGGGFVTLIVRDCVTEDPWWMSELEVAACSPVGRGETACYDAAL